MSKNFMTEQLTQLFTYAELLTRLNSCQELLDPKDGYSGEAEVNSEIEKLKETIKKHMNQHLRNSNVSDRAMTIINNMRYFLNE